MAALRPHRAAAARRPALLSSRILLFLAIGFLLGCSIGYLLMGGFDGRAARHPRTPQLLPALPRRTTSVTGTTVAAISSSPAGTAHSILQTRGTAHYGHAGGQALQQQQRQQQGQRAGGSGMQRDSHAAAAGTAAAAAAAAATAAAAAGSQPPQGTIHTLCTGNGSPYQNYQLRIAYATYRLVQKMPSGERHVAFTRILHRTQPDHAQVGRGCGWAGGRAAASGACGACGAWGLQRGTRCRRASSHPFAAPSLLAPQLMAEIETFRADPLQPACDTWCAFCACARRPAPAALRWPSRVGPPQPLTLGPICCRAPAVV